MSVLPRPDPIDLRTCAFCKKQDITYRYGVYLLFHYSTRRYAHPGCLLTAKGANGLAALPLHLLKQFPALEAERHGMLATLLELIKSEEARFNKNQQKARTVKRGTPRRLWLKGPERDNFHNAVLFESDSDGHYYSDCGRFAIFHMLRGTAEACWEVHEIDENRRSVDMIEGNAPVLRLLVDRYKRGDFVLPDDSRKL